MEKTEKPVIIYLMIDYLMNETSDYLSDDDHSVTTGERL